MWCVIKNGLTFWLPAPNSKLTYAIGKCNCCNLRVTFRVNHHHHHHIDPWKYIMAWNQFSSNWTEMISCFFFGLAGQFWSVWDIWGPSQGQRGYFGVKIGLFLGRQECQSDQKLGQHAVYHLGWTLLYVWWCFGHSWSTNSCVWAFLLVKGWILNIFGPNFEMAQNGKTMSLPKADHISLSHKLSE